MLDTGAQRKDGHKISHREPFDGSTALTAGCAQDSPFDTLSLLRAGGGRRTEDIKKGNKKIKKIEN